MEQYGTLFHIDVHDFLTFLSRQSQQLGGEELTDRAANGMQSMVPRPSVSFQI